MTRMTAQQARDIARAKDPSLAVDNILAAISKAAEEGKYAVAVRDYGFGSGACHYNQNEWPELCKTIVRDLVSLGYRCELRTAEGQFVDCWLSISWSEVKP